MVQYCIKITAKVLFLFQIANVYVCFLANIAHISKNTCNFAARKVMNS